MTKSWTKRPIEGKTSQQLRQTTAATLLINKTLFTKFHNILLVLFEKKVTFAKKKGKKTHKCHFRKITLPVVLTPEAKKQVAVLTKKANET